MIYKAIVPKMTSNNAPAPFVVSRSSVFDVYEAFGVFNPDMSKYSNWISSQSGKVGQYLQIDLGKPYRVHQYLMASLPTATQTMIRSWNLVASNDNKNWTQIHFGKVTTDGTFKFQGDFGLYRYWRVNYLTDNGVNPWASIAKFQLYEEDIVVKLDLRLSKKGIIHEDLHVAGDVVTPIGETVTYQVSVGDVVLSPWLPITSLDGAIAYTIPNERLKPYVNVIKVEAKAEPSGQRATWADTVYLYDTSAHRRILNSFDFGFLTSPRDPRIDNWIGQHYVLSYLNSEIGTNFVFRYRPFEVSGGHIDEYAKAAVRKESKQGLPESLSLSNRQSPSQEASVIEGYTFSWRWVLSAISNRIFYGSLVETIAMIEIFYSLASTDSEAFIEEVSMASKRSNDEKSNAIFNRYNIGGTRRDDLRDILELVSAYQLGARTSIHDTVAQYYDLYSLSTPQPEAIVIGRLLMGYMETYKEGIDFRDLSRFAMEQERDAYQVILGSADGTSSVALTLQNVLSNPTEHKESTMMDNMVIVNPFDKTSVVIEVTTVDELEKTGHLYTVLNAEKDNSNKHSVVTQLLMSDKVILKQAVIEELILTDSLSSKLASYEDIYFYERTSDESFIVEASFADKVILSKEFILPDTIFLDRYGKDSIVEMRTRFFEDNPADANVVDTDVFIDKTDIEVLSMSDHNVIVSKQEVTALVEYPYNKYVDPESVLGLVFINDSLVNKSKINAFYDYGTEWIDKTSWDTFSMHEGIQWVDKTPADSMIVNVDLKAELFRSKGTEGLVIMDFVLVDKVQRISDIFTEQILVTNSLANAQIDVVNPGFHQLPKEMQDLEELQIRTLKIKREAWIQFVLHSVSHMEKVVIIQNNWQAFTKVVTGAHHYNEQASNEIATMALKQAKGGTVLDSVEKVDKEIKNSLIAEYLLADSDKLDGYIMDMMGKMGSDYSEESWEAVISKMLHADQSELNEGIVSEHKLSPEQERIVFIEEMITAHHATEHKREAFIPKDTYRLMSDGSDWEDIWNRYSPGIDILDPPDADFDYETLAAKVYRLETGVPYRPLSPLNVADVKVSTPLHHPLPEHFDLGIDDGKVLAVDNYVFIDMVLAIESLKNRNALRYAGMPAERAMRELFSKLYTWIQQTASSGEEYDRMFRFCRWYTESIIIQLSNHILHRVYNVWRSKFHANEDLGIPHTSKNWTYFSSSQVSQTTDIHAEYKFERENFIDGEFIIRGYFDNPRNEGTMKVMIDGEVVETLRVNGAFTRTIEVPQGKHTYEFIFDGDSGRVSLSTLEISGCEFISAHTTSDDSDANGLKAATLLINHLLSYFDKHHGGGKTKGTMEIKQRRVWNVQT